MSRPPDGPRPDAVRITPAEFKRHLRQTSQFVLTICLIVVTFTAVNVSFDIHAMRRERGEELAELTDLRKGILTRIDALLWKMDTQAETAGVTNTILADALVKMRAQVKESTDTGAKTATATTTIAREAVKQSAATSQLVEAVADTPKPVVNVEVPKAPAPVVVQTPATPVAHTAAAPAAKPAEPSRERGRRHWFRRLPPWKWFEHGSA